MKLTELYNLYTVTLLDYNFRVCVVAWNKGDAIKIATEYFDDGGFEKPYNLEVKFLKDDKDNNFDCDYVLEKEYLE